MGEIRGLFFRIFAGVGLCSATGLAVDRAVFRESFVPVPLDLRVDRRLDAYVPLYQRMLPLRLTSRPISSIDLRALSDDWIRMSQAGKLLPIEASFHGEDLEESPKGQLIESTMRLAAQLTDVAHAELANGMVDDAVADAVRATAVLDSVRFASPGTMMMTSSVARRSLMIASENIVRTRVLPALLLRQIEISKSASARYAECLRRADRQKLVYGVRYGNDGSEEPRYSEILGPKTVSAQKFYGLETAGGLAKRAKACKFVPESKTK